MHAMGFWHEHTRPDRDKHVKIIKKNIGTKARHNFYIQNINQANMVGEYDLCSVMHYPTKYGTGAAGKKTMVPFRKKCSECYGDDCINNCYNCNIGLAQKKNLTDIDIKKINLYYNCKEIGT